MSVTIKKESKPKVKKKKKSKIWILFVVLFSIPLLLVGAVFIMFYDGTSSPIQAKENYNNERVINELLYDSLSATTEEEHLLSIGLRDSYINQIIYNALKAAPSLKKYVKNVYISSKENMFTAVLEGEVLGFFKSNIKVDAKFSYSEIERAFTFKPVSVKVGRVGGFEKLIPTINKLFKLPDLTNFFANAGLRIKVDMSTYSMTYKLEDMITDIGNLLPSNTDSANQLISIFKEIVLSEDLRNISSPSKSLINFDILLEKLKLTSETTDLNYTIEDNTAFNPLVEENKTILKELLDNNQIIEGDINVVSKYIFRGLDKLEDSEKTIINNYIDDGIFTPYSSYIPQYNYSVPANEEFTTVVESQIPANLSEDVHITVNDTNMYYNLMGSPAIGTSFMFSKNLSDDIENNDYALANVMLEKMLTITKNDSLYLVCSLSFNGYRGQITLKFKRDYNAESFGVIKFIVDALYLGDHAVGEESMDAIFEIITKAFDVYSFGDYLTFDVSSKILTIDVKERVLQYLSLSGKDENDCSYQIVLNEASMVGDSFSPGSMEVIITVN